MYDTVIIGGGPAGLTASIYLARAGFKVLVLEKEMIGGQIATAPMVENYPGFIKINGAELASNMHKQAKNFGVDLKIAKVIGIQDGKSKKILTKNEEYQTKTIIIATGAKYRKLGLDVEEKYIGNGVYFYPSDNDTIYKDKIVAVVGGGNSAVINALYLSDFASQVYLIYRGEALKCEKALTNQLKAKSNVEILFNTTVEDFHGEKVLERITIKTNDQSRELELSSLFELIGMDAETDLAFNLIERNANNYIISENCETKIPGIFIAGDCREKDIRQLTTATADGTIAAFAAIKYLQKN